MPDELPITREIAGITRVWAGNAYPYEYTLDEGGVNLTRDGHPRHFPGGVIDRPICREEFPLAHYTLGETIDLGQVGIWVPAPANGTEPV
jgi:hypothetical protein